MEQRAKAMNPQPCLSTHPPNPQFQPTRAQRLPCHYSVSQGKPSTNASLLIAARFNGLYSLLGEGNWIIGMGWIDDYLLGMRIDP